MTGRRRVDDGSQTGSRRVDFIGKYMGDGSMMGQTGQRCVIRIGHRRMERVKVVL